MAEAELFDEIVLCKDCGKKMKKGFVVKNGFKIRVLECPKCKKRIYHPADLEAYKRFINLKERTFNVKLRIVGNSYAISIPKELITFHEEMFKEVKKEIERMKKIVKLCLEEPGKIALIFD